ncbi:glycosyltransferase [Paenarthrobacter sp. DKR-5]|uniref:glycosyltransferase family 2 protein n=1 Tax=Paenarthrobacter sp. DKR-5 TaxID=2835535 RepID=UPI001BDBC5CD|nr:glycosyltransferase family 2 protein [Paenarthrobacter sp. DKR-5]MBT1003020.1 glycosyltransferase [Paenarthrobacter sp. DKR-5]
MFEQQIAAIVPCHNERGAIAKVVADLKAAVPGMTVYVYDNASTDGTDEVARAAGAEVRYEHLKGKGNVVRRAMADIDADIYLLIDGDDTYDAAAAPELIRTLLEGPFDQVTGVRAQQTDSAYRAGHELGNRAFNSIVGRIFGYPVSDMLSGYRVFSRRFVKSFPAVSKAFEIETELTVHAINARVPQAERTVKFQDRAEGTESKLRTYHDGIRILSMILKLVHHERPLLLHGIISGLLFLAGLIFGLPVIVEFLHTGLVPKLPTAVLASSLVLLSVLALMIGILLDGLRKIRQENARTAYLTMPAPAPVRR